MQRDDMPLPICFLDSDDQEREHHIKSLGELMLQSYADGDRKAADQWLQLQQEAIKARTPAQVARMEACYFSERGEQDRAQLAAKGEV